MFRCIFNLIAPVTLLKCFFTWSIIIHAYSKTKTCWKHNVINIHIRVVQTATLTSVFDLGQVLIVKPVLHFLYIYLNYEHDKWRFGNFFFWFNWQITFPISYLFCLNYLQLSYSLLSGCKHRMYERWSDRGRCTVVSTCQNDSYYYSPHRGICQEFARFYQNKQRRPDSAFKGKFKILSCPYKIAYW